MSDWWIFQGTQTPHELIEQKLPDTPSWRHCIHQVPHVPRTSAEDANGVTQGDTPLPLAAVVDPNAPPLPNDLFVERRPGNEVRGATYLSSDTERDLVNAALYLRRPLLVTGKPGTGKTSLAYTYCISRHNCFGGKQLRTL